MAGSGTLDFIEFVQMMTKTSLQSDPYKEIQEAFRVFDTNHTGRVDCSEMKLVFTTIGQCISNSQRFFFFYFIFKLPLLFIQAFPKKKQMKSFVNLMQMVMDIWNFQVNTEYALSSLY